MASLTISAPSRAPIMLGKILVNLKWTGTYFNSLYMCGPGTFWTARATVISCDEARLPFHSTEQAGQQYIIYHITVQCDAILLQTFNFTEVDQLYPLRMSKQLFCLPALNNYFPFVSCCRNILPLNLYHYIFTAELHGKKGHVVESQHSAPEYVQGIHLFRLKLQRAKQNQTQFSFVCCETSSLSLLPGNSCLEKQSYPQADR